MSQRPDPRDMDFEASAREDIEKARRMSRDGVDTAPPALIEIVLLTLASLVAVAWLAALYLWVPETISGTEWMSLGVIGGLIFGGPAVAIYWLRRGGIETIQRLIRTHMG
jgi:hypothetical protein